MCDLWQDEEEILEANDTSSSCESEENQAQVGYITILFYRRRYILKFYHYNKG